MKARVASALGVVLVLGIAIPATASNDPFFPQQWGLAKVGAETAWSRSRGGVTVAVVDTGVDFTHPDLAGKSAGLFDCRAAQTDASGNCVPGGPDDHGHGTWVAGILAATTGNGIGIAGVAPDAKILSVKALDPDGSGDSRDVARGVRFAADHGAKVINLSLGPELSLLDAVLGLLGTSQVADLRSSFDYAAARGALVVAAAGNDGLNTGYAGVNNVYVVGATGPEDEVARYSSSGAQIYAPGGDDAPGCPNLTRRCIATTDRITDGDGVSYRAVQGTSFAAPHVSGGAALLMALGISSLDTVARLNQSADAIGAGRRLNLGRALEQAAPAPPPAAAPPSPSRIPRATPSPPPPAPPPPSPAAPAPTQVVAAALPLPSPSPSAKPARARRRRPNMPARYAAAGILGASTLAEGGGAWYLLSRRRRR